MLYDVKVEFIQKDNIVSTSSHKNHQIFEFINNQYGDMDFPNMHNYIVNIYDEFDGSWKFDRSMDLSYNHTLDCSENIMAWIVRYYANLDSLSMNGISIKEISSENFDIRPIDYSFENALR